MYAESRVAMPYIERTFDRFLADWKRDAGRKPLLVKGARQVGKTESIRRFGRRNYRSFIEINFVESPEFKSIVQDGYSARAVVSRISRIDPSLAFVPGGTLLFFDEIQEFPDIATSFKFFREDGRFDVVSSGSLLGIHYKRISSVPVGSKTDYTLRSLDFAEFLAAKGYGEGYVGELFAHMAERRPFSAADLALLDRLFLDFCILGGMPEVVRTYLERQSFEGSLDLQRQIVAAYRDDVRKYAEGLDQARILNVLDHVPVQLARENKKFQISKVARDARFRDYRGCVEWLRDAGIVVPCHALHVPELPIRANYDESRFKLYMADTGLLVSMLDDESQADLRANGNLGGWKGGLCENIVGEALYKAGADLVYYKREDSTLEEDFFLRTARHLVPVEVKATNARSKSLRTLIASERYPDIAWGVKLVRGNIGFENSILTLPLATAFLLRRLLSTAPPRI